jgi:hypothetical protein
LPLVLVAGGASGAWMSSLRLAQPYSIGLELLSALLLALCWKHIRRPVQCPAGQPSECHRATRATRWVFWLTAGLTALMLLSPAWAPLFYGG